MLVSRLFIASFSFLSAEKVREASGWWTELRVIIVMSVKFIPMWIEFKQQPRSALLLGSKVFRGFVHKLCHLIDVSKLAAHENIRSTILCNQTIKINYTILFTLGVLAAYMTATLAHDDNRKSDEKQSKKRNFFVSSVMSIKVSNTYET